MSPVSAYQESDGGFQFSLRDLFECVTLSGIVAAFAPVVGTPCVAMLTGLNLALAARQGLVALLILMVALLTANVGTQLNPGESGFEREFLVLLMSVALVAWYLCRRSAPREMSRNRPDAPQRRSLAG